MDHSGGAHIPSSRKAIFQQEPPLTSFPPFHWGLLVRNRLLSKGHSSTNLQLAEDTLERLYACPPQTPERVHVQDGKSFLLNLSTLNVCFLLSDYDQGGCT